MAESPTLYASGTTSQAVAASVAVLSAPNVAGLFSFHIDTATMQAGDVVELYLYRKVLTGGNSNGEALLDRITGSAASVNSIPLTVRSYSGIGNDLASTNALQFGLSQLEGTARALPWKLLQY
jgi:hypothetical protein